MGVSRCVVRNCGKTKTKNPQFSFHQFPSNYIIRDEWIKIIESNGGWKDGEKTKVSSVKECCVCSTHFLEACYDTTSAGLRRLKSNSIPSIFPSLASITI